MKFSIPFATGVAFLASSVSALLSPAGWRPQSIYQVMTDRFARTDGSTTAACNPTAGIYCGGTFQGIIDKLDYIQNMGFTAIWISPVVTNIDASTADGESYHGYWAQDIYGINSNFGSPADLVALSSALHSRGMYLMVDVVTNHMAYAGAGDAVDYSIFTPFNSESYFHPFCLIDYNNNTSILVCWEGDNIVALADLRTEDTDVLTVWESWIKGLVANYTIDGLRIDSAREVDPAFFTPFQTAASGIHVLGEVFDGDPTVFCPLQQVMTGMVNYPAYYWITQAFESTSGNIAALASGIPTLVSECKDTTLLGSFLENHDNPRFPSITSDISLDKNAIAFTMLQDGIPIIYEGQEQHLSGGANNANREAIWLTDYSTTSTFYVFITALNQIRTHAISKSADFVTDKATIIYSDSSSIAMKKGDTGYQMVSAYNNLGASGASKTITLTSANTGFTASQALVEVLSCTAISTDSSGSLSVVFTGGLPKVFYPASLLTGSSICTSTTGSGGSGSSTVAVTFNELVTTTYGETIKIVGNTTALGSWAPTSAITLSAAAYTSSNPLWSVTLDIASGTSIQYKFINIGTGGTVTWEGGSNRVYTVPSGSSTATVSDSWISAGPVEPPGGVNPNPKIRVMRGL